MGFEVDTREVRRAAREIKRIAGSVRELSDQSVAQMQISVADNLEGETADAIAEVLTDLNMDIRKISAGLSDVQKALLDYAKRVEEADEEAKKTIESN
ncbi:MAG: WXG100 family type VII secretion target [Clostridia bacterium]|nr:WXG100 family type VII secretion target [Clostridia bacterium]